MRAIPDRVAAEVDGTVAQAEPRAVCRVTGVSNLPADLAETSGLARGASGLLWSHNDAGSAAILYGLDANGALASRVTLTGAGSVDWEDIAAGRCPEGDCLYVADTGDNAASRSSVTIYRVREPGPGAQQASAVTLSARFPGTPMDVEAIFATPDGQVYLVTKGRASPVVLFRMRNAGASGTLEKLAQLGVEPANARDRVTGASADPSGRWVAIRTYRTLQIHELAKLVAGTSAPVLTFDLSALGEQQGEGVALGTDGTVWLSSEAGGKKRGPVLTRLSCTLPG
jgi:hypothetical protein